MKKSVIMLLLLSAVFCAGAQTAANNKGTLKQTIEYLSSDELEGRRTGTEGEKKAYEYIRQRMKLLQLAPKDSSNDYLQEFEVNDGRAINPNSILNVKGKNLAVTDDYFPLSFSGTGNAEAQISNITTDTADIYFWDIKDILTENKTNPHFDLQGAISDKAKSTNCKALILYNTSDSKDELKFEAKPKQPISKIPVLYITQGAYNKYVATTPSFKVNIKIDLTPKKRTGHNVIGYIDNKASSTVVLGAHYDHLGYGEDHNSLYAGTAPMIHNGADDNASGTAAMLELAKMIKKSGSKKFNYLFLSFSGEELGLYGSKYFVEHPTIDLSKVNYMINMDMVGRLNDSTHGLNIGGYGTSPGWGELVKEQHEYFKIKLDSSGSGPSDHTSFYRKDIPVLFFFTGTHSDYHKPSDDADKINYAGEQKVVEYIFDLIKKTADKPKLAFTKTREAATSAKTSFKVSLGIMPDYTYSGNGVRADGVSEGKAAQKAGIKAGDVITAINDIRFTDVQGYMGALGKFNKGDAVKVYVKRGNEELVFDIVF